jgi:hypothetical protein
MKDEEPPIAIFILVFAVGVVIGIGINELLNSLV